MNFPPYTLEELHDRLLKLEKQNRRFKQLGVAAMIGVAALVVMGQAPSKKTNEANEFILRDDGGNIRARLSMGVPAGAAIGYPAAPQLVLIDEKGKERVQLNGDRFMGGLSLYDQQERARGQFLESDGFGLGATLMMLDEQGQLQTRMKNGEVLAMNKIETKHVDTFDADGYQAILGTADLVIPRTGESHKTSAASLVMFDKNKNVIWKAP